MLDNLRLNQHRLNMALIRQERQELGIYPLGSGSVAQLIRRVALRAFEQVERLIPVIVARFNAAFRNTLSDFLDLADLLLLDSLGVK